MEIEFDEYRSRWLRERSAFRPTEQYEELCGGRLRFRLTVTALAGVKRSPTRSLKLYESANPPVREKASLCA
jgi:hypothetical protein